ncbi:pyrroline-5-carboxylate reductase [Stappia sp. BW2]|uniref:pyrroline-5-carboxylate reductase family protein n=1 Tax=Stappia sp. BW2 TaxID=2592622 RepID=UPI0011DE5DEC|nr:pyrroline-5-carboxylate reductase dimerization domain-containing protein [Stappia sp. BW2]TYC67487.1 pyrroline-5-carboxylate reductase [Stappia sp. BW2]
MTADIKVGIIGGTGQLGSAIATAWLESGCIGADQLWISNRSGSAGGFDAWPEITFTASNQLLADACDVILLSVPPALVDTVRISAPDKLILSVMAGVSRDRLKAITGSDRVVRAMSSPAAGKRLAYSPWCAATSLTPADRKRVQALLSACGPSDEVADEQQIEVFTAITGPVPGFAAFFADCIVEYARANGVERHIAERAAKQLTLSAGQIMAEDARSPAEHVQEMIDYAGTTAAGLLKLKELGVADLIGGGLEASTARVRTIAGSD